MVLVAGLDPPWAVGTGLLLPEGGAALQVVHEEFVGLEGAAVATKTMASPGAMSPIRWTMTMSCREKRART